MNMTFSIVTLASIRMMLLSTRYVIVWYEICVFLSHVSCVKTAYHV